MTRSGRKPSLWTAVFVALALISSILAVRAAHAARPLNVSQSIKDGRTLSGQVSWSATISGLKSNVASVSFSIDGTVRSTDSTSPFSFNGDGILDTAGLSNGSHTFTAVATTQSGTATTTASATVQNSAPVFGVSESLPNWQSLFGTVSWSATPSGISSSNVARVDFLVDSRVVKTDTAAPYGDTPGFFDTKIVADGSHMFAVTATATDGRTATAAATMTVANGAPTSQPSFPIYATFYYPWFPETWTVNGAHVFYQPSLGYYSTTDVATEQAHIRAMQYAGMKAAISSWWGPGHYTDSRLKQLMQTTVSMGAPLKWAVYYENEGYNNPTASQIASDLAYMRDNLATNSAYLRVGAKFVVFVYSANDTTCDVASRWKQANDQLGDPAYIDLKVFYGYRNCASQPDSWHQYGPNAPADDQAGYSYSISPGFWRADQSSPLLARDPARWQTNATAMSASNEPWRLVTTFNEWTEGTSIESAQEWASASGYGTYLDALHRAIVGP